MHCCRSAKAPCKVLKPCGVFACILCFSLFYLNFYLPGVGIYLTFAAGGGFGDIYTAGFGGADEHLVRNKSAANIAGGGFDIDLGSVAAVKLHIARAPLNGEPFCGDDIFQGDIARASGRGESPAVDARQIRLARADGELNIALAVYGIHRHRAGRNGQIERSHGGIVNTDISGAEKNRGPSRNGSKAFNAAGACDDVDALKAKSVRNFYAAGALLDKEPCIFAFGQIHGELWIVRRYACIIIPLPLVGRLDFKRAAVDRDGVLCIFRFIADHLAYAVIARRKEDIRRSRFKRNIVELFIDNICVGFVFDSA